jgi:hypothetical protein
MESLISIFLFIGFLWLMTRYGCGSHIHRSGCARGLHDRKPHPHTDPAGSTKGT